MSDISWSPVRKTRDKVVPPSKTSGSSSNPACCVQGGWKPSLVWDAPEASENKAKDHTSTLFTRLRALLQSHGYPTKAGKAKASQSAAALSQKKGGKVNPEASREKSNWIPSLHSYEDFNQMMLQSLDGFMIILSTDGVIIFVADNISSLLGHLPDDIMGKKLLSLLPDEEKSEVYQKIALKVPLPNSVGKHIDFCCHLKRGDAEHGSSPAYEYVKFILSIKDITNEPLVLFRSFLPSRSCESSATNLSLENRFFLVGTVCIFRVQTLRGLFTVKESNEDVLLVPDSDEERLPVAHRSVQGQRRRSRMELLHAEPDAPASEGQVDIVMADQYGRQKSVRVTKRKSVTSYGSTSTLETIPESPATSSLQSFELKPEVGHVEQMDQMGEMEQVDEKQEVDQSLHPPPSITWYINRWEMELMKKFRKQQEKMTQMLQGEIRNQSHTLEMLKEQLQAMQDSKFQVKGQFYMQPSTSRHIHSPEPQSLEPVPKKQLIEPMNRSFPDVREAKHFCGSYSSQSFQFPEELEEPCDASSQPAQELVQCPPQQERLQEQSQQHNVTVENPVLQILLPSQPGLSLPLSDNTHMFMLTQPTTAPVQLVAEQQLSGDDHGESLGGQEDRSHSFLPEDQQEPCLGPVVLAQTPSYEMISSTIIPQYQINSDSNIVTLQVPEDYIQLWQQPEDPEHHLYLQVNTWPPSEQASLQDQVTWVQVYTPFSSAPWPRSGSSAPRLDPSPYVPCVKSTLQSSKKSEGGYPHGVAVMAEQKDSLGFHEKVSCPR
ncbi:circadian clock protein PASD1 isoform 2-T3 [Megaptera novaeangliae]